MNLPAARQGEVWDANLSPTSGHEQAGTRPCLIISVDSFGTGATNLAIVVPLTSKDKNVKMDVRIDPPEGGLDVPSFAMPYQVRTISRERLIRKRGSVTPSTSSTVSQRVRMLVYAA
ncbi:MAG: type II toxin-antitoxin system PemK/MazF family toxin [Patulibacter sp.]